MANLLGSEGSVWVAHPRPMLFRGPVEVLSAREHHELPALYARVQQAAEQGLWAAGFLSYDAGMPASRHSVSMPLAWFGLYAAPESYWPEVSEPASMLSEVRFAEPEERYREGVDAILDYLCAGDTYQVNYASRLLFENRGSAEGLFGRLLAAHPVPHAAWVNTGSRQVASLSPELFIHRQGRQVVTRPMKGTARRGLGSDEDYAHANALRTSEKARAENLMIVDLMRNDLGRVCEFGSVRAGRLFQVERYRSLLQLTSEVRGVLREEVGFPELIAATFPPGSITGAPKLRAMQIIDELECFARGAYCGIVGFWGPEEASFNVAIRTIMQRGSECELGVGSGIVIDSDPTAELRETLLKGSFLGLEQPGFELLETLAWRPESGFVELDAHLARMEASASYFGWPFEEGAARRALSRVGSSVPLRVRLRMSAEGVFAAESSALAREEPAECRLWLEPEPVWSGDVGLRHKTTARERYDLGFASARERGYWDALYANERGEITETATGNVAFEIEGCWVTPPVSCGLLPGAWRGGFGALERAVLVSELGAVGRIAVGNSVRGMRLVAAIDGPTGPVWRAAPGILGPTVGA